MPNKKNKQAVVDLREKVKSAKSIIFTDYRGLKAEDINELRQKIRDEDAEMAVVKNTLINIALEEEGYDVSNVQADLDGPTAAVFSYNDAISPIKILFEFAKRLELPKVKAAFVEKTYNNAANVQVLSELPSREELLAQVVGRLNAPISGFVNVLGGVQRNFVYAIKAIADKKEVE